MPGIFVHTSGPQPLFYRYHMCVDYRGTPKQIESGARSYANSPLQLIASLYVRPEMLKKTIKKVTIIVDKANRNVEGKNEIPESPWMTWVGIRQELEGLQ